MSDQRKLVIFWEPEPPLELCSAKVNYTSITIDCQLLIIPIINCVVCANIESSVCLCLRESVCEREREREVNEYYIVVTLSYSVN